MNVRARNNVTTYGASPDTLLFVHGYGCDKTMWRRVTPAFSNAYTIVTYDITGSGRSDLAAYDYVKYRTLEGHATDLLEICEALDLRRVTIVGHSVGAMIAMLAANRRPELVDALAMVSPSPCYIDDGDYVGGFSRRDVEELLAFQDANYLGWSKALAPSIMGNSERPDLGEELTNRFCQNDPDIARHFAKVTFLSDHRADVPNNRTPTLILQCAADVVAPVAVGHWLRERMPNSTLTLLDATGHCPHVSAPDETIEALAHFLAGTGDA